MNDDDPRDPGTRGHYDYLSRDFYRIVPLDSAKRRALWMRTTGDPYKLSTRRTEIELRAGREGDDAQVLFREGQTLTCADLEKLVDVMTSTRCNLGIDDEGEAIRIVTPSPWQPPALAAIGCALLGYLCIYVDPSPTSNVWTWAAFICGWISGSYGIDALRLYAERKT